MAKKTIYQIRYQLGGTGSTHRTVRAAMRALGRACRASHRGGDCQGISVVAIEYPADGTDPWGIARPLTEAELVEMASL